MNIKEIEHLTNKLLVAVEAAIDKKEEKDEQTEKDEEIIEALCEFRDAVEGGLDELLSAYDR